MPRLIWVFAGRTCHFVGFVMRRFIFIFHLHMLSGLFHGQLWVHLSFQRCLVHFVSNFRNYVLLLLSKHCEPSAPSVASDLGLLHCFPRIKSERSHENHCLRHMWDSWSICFFYSVCVTFSAQIRITTLITRPVEQIRDQAKLIGAWGRYKWKLSPHGKQRRKKVLAPWFTAR